MPSVRVRRRNAYASIQDEDRYNPEQVQDQSVRGRPRAFSQPDASPTLDGPSESTPRMSDPILPPVPPHDPSHLSSTQPFIRRDMGRVNRLARTGSFSYRSFSATDEDSNTSSSPPPPVPRLGNLPPPGPTIYEGTSAEVVVPGPHPGHHHKSSRVQSAISSSPSRGGRESDSDSEYDSEDEDRVMADDEHHHDDDVVDHLDVIGPQSRIYFTHLQLRNATFFTDPQVATVATLTNAANSILLFVSLSHQLSPPIINTVSDLAHRCLSTLADLLSFFRVASETWKQLQLTLLARMSSIGTSMTCSNAKTNTGAF